MGGQLFSGRRVQSCSVVTLGNHCSRAANNRQAGLTPSWQIGFSLSQFPGNMGAGSGGRFGSSTAVPRTIRSADACIAPTSKSAMALHARSARESECGLQSGRYL